MFFVKLVLLSRWHFQFGNDEERLPVCCRPFLVIKVVSPCASIAHIMAFPSKRLQPFISLLVARTCFLWVTK
jgi:hypothetical protein